MKIERELLSRALGFVAPFIPAKDGLGCTDSIFFLRNRLLTFDDECFASHPINMEGLGDFSIHGNLFASFIRRIKTKNIELEEGENQLTIKSGRAKANISYTDTKKAEGFPKQSEGNWLDFPDQFFQGLDFCKNVVTENLLYPVLSNIHCNEKIMEATNNIGIAIFEGKKSFAKNLLIPHVAIKTILNEKIDQYAIGKSLLHLKNKEGGILSVRITQDEYPNLQNEIEGKKGDYIGLDKRLRKSIEQSLEKAVLFSPSSSSTDEGEIMLEFSKDGISIFTANPPNNFDEYIKENLPVKSTIKIKTDLASFKSLLHFDDILGIEIMEDIMRLELERGDYYLKTKRE